MTKEKQRRGFKGKVILRNINNFKLENVTGAFERGDQLYIKLEGGDDMIADYVNLYENEDVAWEAYASNIEEKTGSRPEWRVFTRTEG